MEKNNRREKSRLKAKLWPPEFDLSYDGFGKVLWGTLIILFVGMTYYRNGFIKLIDLIYSFGGISFVTGAIKIQN